jgi:hypothetical protein
MRRRLALAGAQRGFQFPAQTLGFLFQALVPFPQPVNFLLRPIQILLWNKRLLVCDGPNDSSHPSLP